MSKDIFGLTYVGIEKRLVFEKSRLKKLKKVFDELLEQIRFTAEEDGWHRVVIFSTNNPTFNGLSYSERSTVLYYLRKHPNIISKLSDKEKRANALDTMKPYLFKWVDAEEKEKLGTRANYFRHFTGDMLENIGEKSFNKSVSFFADIFSILEFLLGKRNKTWIEISSYSISAFSGVPIENTRAGLNALLKMNLIVMAYVPCEERNGRLRMNVFVTLSEKVYGLAVSGEGIDAVKILTAKDALDENFKFTVVDYFYASVSEIQKENNDKRTKIADSYFQDTMQKFQFGNEQKKIVEPSQSEITLDLENSSAEAEKKVSKVEEKNLPAPIAPSINIVMPEVTGLNQTLDDIKSCVVSFTNIAESMYKSETQKYELLKNMITANTKQREEYDDLYNQMVTMKKILNQKDRDKDKFVKAVQDALNMMMGKIISETDKFSKIPRHMLDEQKLQAHKAQVIQITVQTAEEIRQLANSGQ